jgi:hypothetical protein
LNFVRRSFYKGRALGLEVGLAFDPVLLDPNAVGGAVAPHGGLWQRAVNLALTQRPDRRRHKMAAQAQRVTGGVPNNAPAISASE